MATDLTVALENEPGTLAALGEAAGKAGLNLGGVAGYGEGGRFAVHVLVDDAEAARKAFTDAGIEVTGERDALVVDCEDSPGALGALARKVADAGVNIDVVYVATQTKIVLVTNDNAKAASALG